MIFTLGFYCGVAHPLSRYDVIDALNHESAF